ncbi:putative beta-lactamase-like 1 isoform X2 [Dysidea avara]
MVAAVSYRGEILWSKGYGVIDKKSTTVPGSDTIFRVGSISKVFAVLTVFQLLERGHIKSLDDPLSDYCPSFSMKSTFDTVVTLRQVMADMSGLPGNPPCYLNIFTKTLCPDDTHTILSRLKEQYLTAPPWTRPSYSNLGYSLLARCVLEKFDPQATYENYVEKNILEPLNMASTGFDYTDSVKSRMATGYNTDGSEDPLLNLGWAAPAGQMYSTINDLMKFARFFTSAGQDGKVLRSDFVREMMLPVFVDYDFFTGFGTPFEMLLEGTYLIRSKGGIVGGFSGYMTFIPELELSYVVLLNGANPPGLVVVYPYAVLLAPFVTVLADIRPKHPLPPNPEAYVGNYTDQLKAFEFVILLVDNQLAMGVVPSYIQYVFLSYHDELLFQLDLPDLYTCELYEIIGVNDQWLYFDKVDSKTGKSPGFTFPSLTGTDKITRID